MSAWPQAERPRERLVAGGAESLSDAELLAIILRVGSRATSALDVARQLITTFGSLRRLATARVAELVRVHGVGVAKAAQVAAAFELGRRLSREPCRQMRTVRGADDVIEYCREWFGPYLRDRKQEVFSALLLDARNRVLRAVEISAGTLTASLVHPREVLRAAISESAAALIVVHNHPSGDTAPSPEDIAITQRLAAAGKVIGLHLLDHVIIGDGRPFSFLEQGLLPP